MSRFVIVVAACIVASLSTNATAQSSDLAAGARIQVWSIHAPAGRRVGNFQGLSGDSLVMDLKNPQRRVAVLLSAVERLEVSAGTRSPRYGAIRGATRAFLISTTATVMTGLTLDLLRHPKKNGEPILTIVLPIIVVPPATIIAAANGHSSPPDIWERVLWRRK